MLRIRLVQPAGLHFDAMDIIGQSSKLVSVDTAKPKISVYEIDASLSIGTPQLVFDVSNCFKLTDRRRLTLPIG